MAYREDSGTFKFLALRLKDQDDRATTREDDYLMQRRTILESVEAGRKLEVAIDRVERSLDSKISEVHMEKVYARIAALERAQETRNTVFGGVAGALKALAMVAAGAVATAILDHHKGQ
jgi:hypothetical protein